MCVLLCGYHSYILQLGLVVVTGKYQVAKLGLTLQYCTQYRVGTVGTRYHTWVLYSIVGTVEPHLRYL